MSAVDGVADRMRFLGSVAVGGVADATLDPVAGTSLDVLHQFAELLRSAVFTARGVAADLRHRRQVEDVREQSCEKKTDYMLYNRRRPKYYTTTTTLPSNYYGNTRKIINQYSKINSFKKIQNNPQ